ncbi:MAG: hypothetical protein M0Z51_16810 [Propionibacterium sp.]|nr:hypothetical protein [Propionibacterium sp.]
MAHYAGEPGLPQWGDSVDAFMAAVPDAALPVTAQAATLAALAPKIAPTLTAVTPIATFSAEMAPTLDLWAYAGGASWSAPNATIPAGGSISTTLPVIAGTTYQIVVTRSSSTGANMVVSIGTASISVPSWDTNTVTVVANATGNLPVTVGGFTATVQSVSIKAVTAFASPSLVAGVAEFRSGGGNTGTGSAALLSNTTGDNNTGTGNAALQNNTTGGSNTGTGRAALLSNTTGDNNTGTGNAALQNNTTGGSNTGTGRAALLSNTTGGGNTGTGSAALQNNTTGGGNTGTGYAALQNNTTGDNNTGTGNAALQNNTTGSNNTGVGFQAGYTDGTTATVATVNNTTLLGFQAQALVSNVAVIGSRVAANRQSLCLGNYGEVGSGLGVFALSDAATAPTTNPTGGGVLFSEAGALKWRGSSGTVTVIAVA